MDVQEIAREAFAVLGTGRQVAPFSARWPDFRLEDAYRVAAAVRTQRETRGERPVGRKIGFTNRTIWAEYNVHAPMWGYLYDRTVRDLPNGSMGASLRGLAEPRIEPEIVFGLATAPAPGMNERALLGCIDWVAHGFEIVQSIFPGWKFEASDTIAANGVHGALLIGPRHPFAPHAAEWRQKLSTFEIELACDGRLIDRGTAENVLGGPLSALRHLVGLLASDPVNPKLAAGEIVSTGTLTKAMPVAPGETWTATPKGIPLDPVHLRFV